MPLNGLPKQVSQQRFFSAVSYPLLNGKANGLSFSSVYNTRSPNLKIWHHQGIMISKQLNN
jgi:hypothetical protein